MQQDGHSIEGTAGPIMLFKVYLEYMKHQEQLLSSSYPSSNNHNHDIEKDTRDGSIFIAPPSALFPYSWEHDRKIWGDCSAMSGKQNTTRCIERMRDRLKDPIKDTMYTITYWSHSWGGGFQGGEKADGK